MPVAFFQDLWYNRGMITERGQSMKKKMLSKTWVVALLAFFSCFLWGSAFAAVKTSYEMLHIDAGEWASQLVFGGLRFAVAGVMAIGFGSICTKRILLPARQSLPKIGIISLFQTILQYFCYYIGLAHTSGVRAAVLVGVNVFMAILISSLLFHLERFTARKLIGSMIGFSGIILINLNGLSDGSPFSLIGEGLILLCTVSSGFSSACMKKLSGNEDPVMLSGWQFFFGGLVLMGIGLLGGGVMPVFSAGSFALLLYLAFISAAAYSVWALLLKHNPVSRVAVFGFLNPVCGVIISAVVLHEAKQIDLSFLAALLLVCAGIVTVNYTKSVPADNGSDDS